MAEKLWHISEVLYNVEGFYKIGKNYQSPQNKTIKDFCFYMK